MKTAYANFIDKIIRKAFIFDKITVRQENK